MLIPLWRRAMLVCVSALLVLALVGDAPARAQKGDDDALKRTEALDTVARQKLEAELKEAFALVDRQAAVSQVRALTLLKQKREQVSSEISISETTRRQLLARIDEKYRAVETGKATPNRPDLGPESTPEKRAVVESEREQARKLTEERLDVRRSIETIEVLVKSGREEQAKKEAEALVKRHPNNPAALAFGENISMNQRVYEAKVLLAQQAEGFRVAMHAVDKSAVMPKDDIEFDTIRKGYFKEITEKRKAQLSAREKALLKALDAPIDFSIRGKSLEDALQVLSDQIGQPILIDKSSLPEGQLDTNALINLNLKNVQTRTALRKLLQDNGLTYILKNETIQVLTVEKARSTLSTRVYYLADLAQGVGPFGGGAAVWGPQIDQFQTAQNVQMLVDTIKKIDPLSWRDEGGMGSITFHAPSVSVIVRQTAEFHARMSSLGLGR